MMGTVSVVEVALAAFVGAFSAQLLLAVVARRVINRQRRKGLARLRTLEKAFTAAQGKEKTVTSPEDFLQEADGEKSSDPREER